MSKRRSTIGRWYSLVAAGGILLVSPARADAHAAVQGMGEFVGGFLHPLLTPLHVLTLLSLGLLLGQSRPFQIKLPMAAFMAAAALGLTAAGLDGISEIKPVILVAIGLVTGGLVAAALPLLPWVRIAVAVIAGLALGLDSGPGSGVAAWPAGKTLFATWVSLFVLTVNVAFYSARLPALQWVQTGVRVVGSWIVAIAFLMLAFALRR